jgi:signal peptidase I
MPESAADITAPAEAPPAVVRRRSGLRQIADSLVCLAVAVVLFRTFLVEGYMISTGSMAPALLGYHKQVVCPACEHAFAYGIAYDSETARVVDGSVAGESQVPQLVVCPNCGQREIDVANVPPNQGDQLLVHKDVYAFEPPHRWEVAVFRNPYKLTQAYVKRVVGLPGETVRIDGGDVFVNGELARKSFDEQRAMRILVHNQDHEPRDADWQPRWAADPEGWRREGQTFVLGCEQPGCSEAAGLLNWLTYRHWIRSGGWHETSVTLPETVRGLAIPDAWLPVQHEADTRRLSCVGVLSETGRDRLLALNDDPDYLRAIQRLYARAHLSPVTDNCGYNHGPAGAGRVAVRDVMIASEVTIEAGDGAFAVQMTDGDRVYQFRIDVGAGEMVLGTADEEQPVHKAALADDLVGRPVLVEMSLIDRQVLVALDGEPVFAPWPVEPPADGSRPPRKPVRVGARGLKVRVDHLRLYRDVYYTETESGPCRLGPDEYYVLGDNSPVSHDSRRWPQPAVHESLLLGKPFVVHLPSRQAKVTVGSMTRHIRIPDLPRIRYIR